MFLLWPTQEIQKLLKENNMYYIVQMIRCDNSRWNERIVRFVHLHVESQGRQLQTENDVKKPADNFDATRALAKL